jgi:alpha-tubulin suppressor-like RCC1 family protein
MCCDADATSGERECCAKDHPRRASAKSLGPAGGSLRLAAILAVVAGALAAPASASAEGGMAVAWGYNTQTQLGAGYKSGHQASPVAVLHLNNVTAVAAAYHFSLALEGNGTVKAWGGNSKGQLGDGSREDTGTPTEIVGLSGKVKSISSAGEHALALLTNGTVASWGAAEYGERGNGESGSEEEAKKRADEKGENYTPRDIPEVIPNLEHVVAIASGGASNFALLENGTVMSWGEDGFGILGYATGAPEQCKGEVGILPCSTVPRAVSLPEGVTVQAIAGGGEAAYALLSNGEVLSWGNNGHGQLGDGSTTSSSTPVKVDLPKLEEELKMKLEVVAISGGALHALALLKNGLVIGWGANGVGQLGEVSADECHATPQSCSQTPKLITGLEGVSAVSAGRSFSLVLKAGQIYAFGDNEPWGQLGIGSTTNTRVPTPIKELEHVAGLGAGEQHSLAFLEAGFGPPPPEFAVLPDAQALNVVWTFNAAEYHVRYRFTPGTGAWNPIVAVKGPCTTTSPCSHLFAGLVSGHVYEVQLNAYNGGKLVKIFKGEAAPE